MYSALVGGAFGVILLQATLVTWSIIHGVKTLPETAARKKKMDALIAKAAALPEPEAVKLILQDVEENLAATT